MITANDPNNKPVLKAALQARDAGISTIPISADGSKRPALLTWDEHKTNLPNFGQIKKWFGNGHEYGLAIIGGAVSGNLEGMDFDNREYYTLMKEAAFKAGLADLVNRIENGYLEYSPKGVHWFYRCPEGIDGSTKLARRVKKDEDGQPVLNESGKPEIEVLIETKGEGGYVIVAPSGGKVHPTGQSYRAIKGDLSTIATITREERAQLLTLARTFNELDNDKHLHESKETTAKTEINGARPGDDFNARTSWEDLLGNEHWHRLWTDSRGVTYWRRPGKQQGISATTNFGGTDLLYVFTTSTEFESETSYSKFAAYAVLYHGGDMRAAARELAIKGYGEKRTGFKPVLKNKKIDPKTGEVVRNGEYERPSLSVQIADLHVLNPLIWEALRDYNDPPHLFRYAGRLQRFEVDGDKWRLEEINENIMRFEITEAIEWVKTKDTKDGPEEIHAVPPRHVAQNLLADSNPQLPILTRVVETPVFTKDGDLIATPGYHESGVFYYPSHGLDVPPVSDMPDEEEINRAKKLIDELLIDFPFATEGERTNALSIFFDPYIREMVKGCTPLRLIEASTPGSGKGLLADVLTRHATGQPGIITQCQNDEEWNKSLISQLRANVSVILIDNLGTSLDSTSLAAALTSEYYGGRLLGTNDTAQWPNRAIWLATANNPTMTTEIARRTVRIRLDPKQDRPWQRDNFKHSDLRLWAEENRNDLVWSALTLIQAWIKAGKPAGQNKPLGSFEHWSRTLGGLLEFLGYKGFLSNLNEFYEVADLEGAVLRSFIKLWWETYGDQKVTVSELFKLTEDFTDFDLGKGSERSQRTVFGLILKRQRDRVIGDFVIKSAGILHGMSQWKLVRTSQMLF